MVLFSCQKAQITAVGSNFSLHTCKMQVKKCIFSTCIFLRVKIWGPLSVVLISDQVFDPVIVNVRIVTSDKQTKAKGNGMYLNLKLGLD